MARVFTGNVYRTTRRFPKEELFDITSQLRRAAVSIPSNIAEGSDRKSDVEFIRYLRMSLTSLNEVVTQLYLTLDQGFLNPQNFNELYREGNRLAAIINALANSMRAVDRGR